MDTKFLSRVASGMDIPLRKRNATAVGLSQSATPRCLQIHHRSFAREQDMNRLNQFLQDQSGATAIEYGLIAAGISVAIIAVVNALGTQLQTTFSTVSSQLATAGK